MLVALVKFSTGRRMIKTSDILKLERKIIKEVREKENINPYINPFRVQDRKVGR